MEVLSRDQLNDVSVMKTIFNVLLNYIVPHHQFLVLILENLIQMDNILKTDSSKFRTNFQALTFKFVHFLNISSGSALVEAHNFQNKNIHPKLLMQKQVV